MRPTHPTLDPPGPPRPSSYNSVGHIFCKSNALFKPLKVDHNVGAHLALRGGAGSWVTNICGLGFKSFIAPSRRLTTGPHEALTTESNCKEIVAWCLHSDTVKRGNNTQPDKASVKKERGCGTCPTQQPPGIMGGGVGTHPPPPPFAT